MKKKGVSGALDKLIFFVLGLVIVVVILLVIKVWYDDVSGHTPKEVCRQSVDAAALSNIGGVDLSAEVNCPTQYKEIKTNDENTIKRELANQMSDCWWQFGEGKKELFSAASKTYCVVCSVTSFENKDKKVRGFSKYLIETNAPGKKIKYIDYFNGYETSKAEEIVGGIDPETLAGLENEELDTSKSYATLFVYAKGKDEMQKIANHLFMRTPEGKGGAIVGGILGVGAGISTGFGVVGVLGLLVSNPVGWAAGIGIGAAAITVITVEAISYRFSSDNAPEWAAFVVFREYSSEAIKDLGCMELPAKQNQ